MEYACMVKMYVKSVGGEGLRRMYGYPVCVVSVLIFSSASPSI